MGSTKTIGMNLLHKVVAAALAVALCGALPVATLAQEAQEGVVKSALPTIAPQKPGADDKQDEKKGDKSEPPLAGVAKPPQSNTQTQNQITQPLALSPEVPPDRTGVDLNQKQLLTLQEAITMALQNNIDIEVFRHGVEISQYSLNALYGFYDLTSGAQSGYRNRNTANTNFLSGGGSTAGDSISSSEIFYDFTTNQQIQRTGGNYQIDFSNSRTKSGSAFAFLNPAYDSTLTFTFTQPLMRNFSIDANRRAIQIAQKSLTLSDSQFRQRVIDTINLVQRAYWDLVFAIQNERIARDSVELTRTQLENNRKMVEAGTLAPIELRSTEAQLEQGKGNIISALQQITIAENTLKGLILKESGDRIWSAVIEPTDQPIFGQVMFNLTESTALALKNRPELDQIKLQVEQKDVDIAYYKNQLKPQVDFIGIYGSTGSAGTLIDRTTGQPFPNQEGRFAGSYFQGLSNLFGQDFRNYQVGVRISFPWRNRTAEANYGRVLAESKQLDARQRQLVQNVQIEVRNSLQAVEAARLRFEAARAGRIAAEAQLRGEEERFRAGLVTNFFVLQRQTELSTARGTEIRALTDYNKALADLQRVTGMTLVSNNVKVDSAKTDTNK